MTAQHHILPGNILKIANRYVSKNRGYAALNLVGLAVGFAAFIFSAVYVYFETHFESFHPNAGRIYRATYRYSPSGEYKSHWARIPFDYINNLPQDVQGIKTLVRFQNHARKYVRIGQEKFKPAHAYVADNAVFQVFNFELAAGDAATALSKPHSVVISQSLALKYFGSADPIGRELSVIGDLDSAETLHHVTAVMKDLPKNTHLPVDMLLSFRDASERTGWAYTYILTERGVDIDRITAQMPSFIRKYSSEEDAKNDAIVFQPLSQIHLGSDLARELVPNGNPLYVKIIGFAGVLILAIAVINFMNLGSAMALGRAKEIGIRKVLGATRIQLICFLLAESVVHTLAALIVGAGITYMVFPFLQQIVVVGFLPAPWPFALMMVTLGVVAGLVSGIYPVVLLMALKPTAMLKSTSTLTIAQQPGRQFNLKRALVTLQFGISILLLGSALIAYNQFRYLNEKSAGMQREQIVTIPGVPDPVKAKFETFKHRLSRETGIKGVSACMEVPSREIRDAGPVLIEGVNSDPAKAPVMDIQVIDHDFVSLLGLSFVAGGNVKTLATANDLPQFNETFTIQNYLLAQPREYLINETAMHQLGWQSPAEAVGQKISWSIGDLKLAPGAITGVVRDFHQESLKNKIDPVILVQEPVWLRTFLVKVEAKDVRSSVETIHAVWNDLFPFYPMEYFFLDDLYNNLYKGEQTQLQILFISSALAIVLAFTGLVGLVAYALKTRTKELAIRQVLGAHLHDLIGMMSREYIIVLAIGAIIAIPVSLYVSTVWLEGFAYHVEIAAGNYVLAVVSIVTLIVTTVGLQTLKASKRNPAQTLREE